MEPIIIGIDPGATGALAVYDKQANEIVGIIDMPMTEQILTTKKKKKSINGKYLFEILEAWKNMAFASDRKLIVHIEKVQAFTKQSAIASFNFGYAACWPEALCVALDIEYKLITPQKWKRHFFLQATEKDAARQYVLKMFPETARYLTRKKDVDRADAVLLAVYED